MKIRKKFWTKSNTIIISIIWGAFTLIFLLNASKTFFNNPINIFTILSIFINNNIITLFAALSAVTGILYSTYKSDVGNDKQLKNSNKELIEELTRNKKEDAIFNLIKDIMYIINENLKIQGTHWIASIDSIAENYEESQKINEHCYFNLNLYTQNEIYYYFTNLINKPLLFNYLPPNIQNEIKRFEKDYYSEYTQFNLFVLSKYEGSYEDIKNKINLKYYDYWILKEDSINHLDEKKCNYLIRGLIKNQFLDSKKFTKYNPNENANIVTKIRDKDFKKLEFILNKICYLAYLECSKYGYQELN